MTGYISDRIGRKLSILLACVPYVLGFLLIGLSYVMIPHTDDIIATSTHTGPYQYYLIFLLIGRLMSGFGVGALSLVVPVIIVIYNY